MSDELKTRGINSQGFGIIAKSVMRDPTLIAGAKALYAYICSYVGAGTTAWPGQDTICHDLDIEAHTYTRYLAALRSHDYIRVEQVQGKGGRFGHNVYEIVMEPCPQFPCPEKPDMLQPYAQKPHAEKLHANSNSTNNVVVDPPTPLNTTTTQTQEQTTGTNRAAQSGGPVQPVDKSVNQPGDAYACVDQQLEQLSGLEEKTREDDTTVTGIQAAIRTVTGADVPAGDIHAILADYAPEAILEKIQLMGSMGRQELRNVPGILIHLLKDDSRHISGRARGRAAPKQAATRPAGKAGPGRKGKKPVELNPHEYMDPEQAAKLEALRAEETRRALAKELAEREREEKHREFMKTLLAN